MDNISELINAAKYVIGWSFGLWWGFVFRERLAEVHDEYEERERRWNRIASLLDREDFISIATGSTGIDNSIETKMMFHFNLI
jgi:hypothetical protein